METYNKYYSQFEHGFFANSTFGVLVQSCVGGIAAMSVLSNGNSIFQMVQLFIVVMLSVGYNMSILSQQKPKFVFNTLLVSVGLNILISVANWIA